MGMAVWPWGESAVTLTGMDASSANNQASGVGAGASGDVWTEY